MPAAAGLVGKVKTQLPREQQTKGLVNVMPGKDFGETLVVKQMAPSLQHMIDIGALVPAPVFEALLKRLEVVLTVVAGCLDHFRVEIVGRPGYKAIAAELGCAKCGALQAEDGTALKMCRACGVVFYCSEWHCLGGDGRGGGEWGAVGGGVDGRGWGLELGMKGHGMTGFAVQ
jgi:hypothetical protein